jgi:tyrosyl-tRNA synthetase
MSLKKRLAYEITAQFHGVDGAASAQAHFERVHQQRDVPEDAPAFALALEAPPERPSALLVRAGLAASASEAKRLLNQGAVSVLDPASGGWRTVAPEASVMPLEDGSFIRVGKNRFRRVVRQ